MNATALPSFHPLPARLGAATGRGGMAAMRSQEGGMGCQNARWTGDRAAAQKYYFPAEGKLGNADGKNVFPPGSLGGPEEYYFSEVGSLGGAGGKNILPPGSLGGPAKYYFSVVGSLGGANGKNLLPPPSLRGLEKFYFLAGRRCGSRKRTFLSGIPGREIGEYPLRIKEASLFSRKLDTSLQKFLFGLAAGREYNVGVTGYAHLESVEWHLRTIMDTLPHCLKVRPQRAALVTHARSDHDLFSPVPSHRISIAFTRHAELG